MKASMNRWLAILLLVWANGAAHAQQAPFADQSNPNGQQQNQSGQKPSQPPQQPGNNLLTYPSFNFSYVPLNGQSQASSHNATAFHNWVPARNGGLWTDVSDLNTEMTLAPADDALRAQLNLPKDQGLIVTSLAANTPSALAGIQQDDVLLELGDAALAKTEDLEEGLKAAGEKAASLTILRGGKRVKILVQPRVRVAMGPVQPDSPAFWIGVSVSPLEPALRAQLKIPPSHGLLAIDIVKDSPAAQADVKVHDILLSLDGNQLDSQEKLVELVQSNGEKPVPLELIRGGNTQKIVVTPQRRKPSQHRTKGSNRENFFSYRFVRPGAVVNGNADAVWVDDVVKGIGQAYTIQGLQPAAGSTASATRLDQLDAELKQLRKAIEELNKILKEKK